MLQMSSCPLGEVLGEYLYAVNLELVDVLDYHGLRAAHKGDGVEYVMRRALQELGLDISAFNPANPIQSIFHDMGKALQLVDWDNMDTEDFLRAFRALAAGVGGVGGIPAKTAVDIGTGFSDVLSGDFEKGIAEIIGFSPFISEKAAEEE